MRDVASGLHSRRGDRRGFGPRLWFGLALLGLGVVWTLDNLRFVDGDEVLDWWPLLLVAVGVTKVLGWGMGGRARPFAGLFWITAGALLLMHNLRYLPWGLHDLWPIGLVLLGLALVWRSVRGVRAGSGTTPGDRGVQVVGPIAVLRDGEVLGGDTRAAGAGETCSTARVVDTSDFSAVAIWAGVGRKITSQQFRGGDFTAIMGGGELDLRNAKPVPGGCVIEVCLVMGGLDIQVPGDWTVVNELFAFMGGIEDSRTASVQDGPNVLVLKGFAVMGGVEIKN